MEPKRYGRLRYKGKYEVVNGLLLKDLAVRTYLADLSKAEKPTSQHPIEDALATCRVLLQRVGRQSSEPAIKELVQFKRDNPNDTT